MKYAETIEQLAAKLRQAMGKPPQRRTEIAGELGMTIQTLDRKIELLKAFRLKGLRRHGRNDKGRSRAVPAKLINVACAVFFLRGGGYRQAHRETAQRCVRLGLREPSYYSIRRCINEAFRRATAGRIQRMGNFERRR